MSDCNHFWIMPDAPECVAIVCRACRKPLLAVEANAIINRAERAEARVKELEFAVMNREGYIETLESIIAKTQLQINGITINRKRK